MDDKRIERAAEMIWYYIRDVLGEVYIRSSSEWKGDPDFIEFAKAVLEAADEVRP